MFTDQTKLIEGPAGQLEVRYLFPTTEVKDSDITRLALVCHPHPLYGGTMDNKVVTTLGKALLEQGLTVALFNYRGVGNSRGQHDYANGEVDDAQAVITHLYHHLQAAQPLATAPPDNVMLVLCGFSFGAYIAAALAHRLTTTRFLPAPQQLKLIMVAPVVDRYPMQHLILPAHKLMIVGEQDEMISAQKVIAYAEQVGSKYAVITGATHFFHGKLAALKNLTVQFLAA